LNALALLLFLALVAFHLVPRSSSSATLAG